MAKPEHVAYGFRCVQEMVRSGAAITRLYFQQGKRTPSLSSLLARCEQQHIPIEYQSDAFLTKRCQSPQHQGVIAVFTPRLSPWCFLEKKKASSSLCVYLDHIQDPHNFGAILRTAHYFGVDQLFYPQRRCAPLTPTVTKTSAGAVGLLALASLSSPSAFLSSCKKQHFTLIGTVCDGGISLKELPEALFHENILLILGHEGKGMGQLVQRACDYCVTIANSGHLDSLNVSVAAGILLHHIAAMRPQ